MNGFEEFCNLVEWNVVIWFQAAECFVQVVVRRDELEIVRLAQDHCFDVDVCTEQIAKQCVGCDEFCWHWRRIVQLFMIVHCLLHWIRMNVRMRLSMWMDVYPWLLCVRLCWICVLIYSNFRLFAGCKVNVYPYHYFNTS